MDTQYTNALVQAGQPAPDFDLPAASGDGRATLQAYTGRTPLLLCLLRSFSCPFCRRLIASAKGTADKLADVGVDYLGVTTTPLKQARLYSRYRPPGLPLASDPQLVSHRAYGVPIYRVTRDEPTNWPTCLNPKDLVNIRLNPTGELPEALPVIEASNALDEIDGFEPVSTDEAGPPADLSPLVSYFLIDRGGIVRWLFVEALSDPSEYGKHPSDDEVLEAAHAMVGG